MTSKYTSIVRGLSLATVVSAIIAAAPLPALSDARHAIGSPGNAAAVDRTVTMTAHDIGFDPTTITVRPGETVRFVVKNTGQLLHEFNIGTAAMHAEHRKEMMQMMESGMLTPTELNTDMPKMGHGSQAAGAPMKHDDPNTVLVSPGQTAELVWTFPKGGAIEFACNIPGHYEAGMVGAIRFGR